MLGEAGKLPADNIEHWHPHAHANDPLVDPLSAAAPAGVEEVHGGLLGGAMAGLASLTAAGARRASAFQVAACARCLYVCMYVCL